MAVSFTQLQQDVLLQLEGFVADQAVVGVLGSSVSDTATSITLPVGGSAGVWELNAELVNVTAYNPSSGAATVIRGWRGTTAVAHNAGVVCRNNPRFPVAAVKRAINDTVVDVAARIPAVTIEDFEASKAYDRYELPATVNGVLGVYASDSLRNDVPIARWKFQKTPGGGFDGSASVEVLAWRGADIRVVCSSDSVEMGDTDDFSDCGLPAFCKESVVWGAMWRLYSATDLGRAVMPSADQALMATQTPVGKATDLAKYLLGMYQQSLEIAEKRFNDVYPAQKHYVW